MNVALSPLDATPSAPLLARVCFGDAPGRSVADVLVPLPPLSEPRCEWWFAQNDELRRFERHGYACADDGTHLFFRRLDTAASDIEAAAEHAYRDLLALLEDSGYRELLRIWNYFDELTVGEGDDERYRRFCLGRHRAIVAPDFERRLPAATVIGTTRAGLQLFGFASKQAGEQIENPRQTSAFRYPREFGPRSPSFSRATRYGSQLLVSGTAAIVGHETRHAYDAVAQAQEMLANVDALLTQAGGAWTPSLLKLYVFDPADAPAARAAVLARFGAEAPLLVLNGEVCRRGLMVEIEGLFEQRSEQRNVQRIGQRA
ncbi:hypothetical protein [Hydrocarboniphaga effusa]|uniref:chorismate transformation enzyme, FkbO/Hyg5 family n=1 Tax=Hydrocarboniphaga effusa TaxID=243629 RepID=UPI003137EF5E